MERGRPRTSPELLVLAVAISLLLFTVYYAEAGAHGVGPSRGGDLLTVSPTDQRAVPGNSATFVVTVNNDGFLSDNVTLRARSSDAWGYRLGSRTFRMPPRTSKTTTLTVDVPDTAPYRTSSTVVIDALSSRKAPDRVLFQSSVRQFARGVNNGTAARPPGDVVLSRGPKGSYVSPTMNALNDAPDYRTGSLWFNVTIPPGASVNATLVSSRDQTFGNADDSERDFELTGGNHTYATDWMDGKRYVRADVELRTGVNGSSPELHDWGVRRKSGLVRDSSTVSTTSVRSQTLTGFDLRARITDANGSPVEADYEIRCTQGLLTNTSGLQLQGRGNRVSLNDVPKDSKLWVDAGGHNTSLTLFNFEPVALDPRVSVQEVKRPSKAPLFKPRNGRTFRYVEVNATGFHYSYANVSIHYTDEEVGPDEERLKIAHYTDGRWRYEETHVDTQNNLATANVTSFSPFALVAQNTSFNATVRIFDTKGDSDSSNDQLLFTKTVTGFPANGSVADLGHVGTIYKNVTYRVDVRLTTNNTYDLDGDYFRETFLRGGKHFSLKNTTMKEYVVTTGVLADSGNSSDVYVTQEATPDYDLAGALPEKGRIGGDVDILYVEQVTPAVHKITQTGVGDGTSWTADSQVATTNNSPHDIRAADLDLDGDRDFVSVMTKGWVETYINDGTGSFTVSAFQGANASDYKGMALGDVTGDGYPDLVVGSKTNRVYLYPNDGSGGFSAGSKTEIYASSGEIVGVAVGDFDDDNDLDVASADSGGTTLYVNWNTDGSGGTWSTQTVTTGMGGEVVKAGDVNGDGTVDIVTAHSGGLDWWDNSSGTWSGTQITNTQTHDIAIGDVDGDGDNDILYGDKNGNGWHENTAGDGSSWTTNGFGSSETQSVSMADADGDGDPDLFTGDKNSDVIWWENDGTTSWTQHNIDTSAGGIPYGLSAVNYDADAGSSYVDYYVSTDENVEGTWPTFSQGQNYSFGLFLWPDGDWTEGEHDNVTLHVGHEAGDGWTLEEERATGAVRTPIQVSWSWNVTLATYYPQVATSRTTGIVKPSGSYTYNVTVTNDGQNSDTITLSASESNPTWSHSLGKTSFTLSPGESQNTTLTVTAPAGSTGNATNTTLRANSTSSAMYSTKRVTTSIVPRYNVSTTTDHDEQKVGKGESVSYNISAENTGWDNDTYEFTIEGNTNDNFTVTLENNRTAVRSEGTGTIVLNVTGPTDLGVPLTTNTTVRATSTNDSTVHDDVTVHTYLGAPAITNPKKWHLEFDQDWDQPYRSTGTWRPKVWLENQNEKKVSGATVNYVVKDINDDKTVGSGTASDNGDGSYSFAFTADKTGNYWEIETSTTVDNDTLTLSQLYYSGPSDSGYRVPYKMEWYDFSDGPTMKGGSDKNVTVALHGHHGELLTGQTVYLRVIDRSGTVVQSQTQMTDNGDGTYSYTLPAASTSAGNDYLFQSWTNYSSSYTNNRIATVQDDHYLRAIAGDYNPPVIWGVHLSPFIPAEGENVSLDAKMADDSGLEKAQVQYRLNDGPWIHVNMTRTGTLDYRADLGTFYAEHKLEWKLYAQDINTNHDTYTDRVRWISTATTNATSAKLFLDQDSYMFGYLKSIRDGIKTDSDGDGVLWPLKTSATTAWENQVVEKNTVRATALVLDERGKPRQSMDQTRLNFWIVNETGGKIVVNGSDLKTADDGRYIAVFRGSKKADGSWDDPAMGPKMWGQFDSGKVYYVNVSVDGDYVPEDRAPFLAYGYGDAFYYRMWQDSGGSYSRGTHCENNGCNPDTNDPHQAEKKMWARGNDFSAENDPTCGMCHGVQNVTNYNTEYEARTHPHPYETEINVSGFCVNDNCHGQGWAPATDETMPADMPVPGYSDGTYNLTYTDEHGVNRTKETWSPDFCGQCHGFPSGIKPPTEGHNDFVGCKFCHQNFHNINELSDWDPETLTGQPGYATGGYDNCWKDCHQVQEYHNGYVRCDECHTGFSDQPQHEERMWVTGQGTGGKESSMEFCGFCHQNSTYTYKGVSPPQVPDPIVHGNGSSWNTSMNYDRPYWVDQDMACRYCHGRTYNLDPALGREDDWKGNNSLGQPLTATTFCSGCHRANYTSGTHAYPDMVTTYNDSLGLVPPEAFGNPPHAPTSDPRYVAMDTWPIDTQNYTDTYCVDCHVMGGTQNMVMKNFVHNVTTDSVSPDVANWTLNPPDVNTGVSTTVNVTALIQDPQGIVNTSHDPTLNWRINGTAQSGSDVMTSVGNATWNGTISYTSWSSHANDVLIYNVTDMRDLIGNTGDSSDETDLIQPSNNQPPTVPGLTAPTGGETWNGTREIHWTASTDDGTTGFTVTYDVDYTSDGANWNDLTDHHTHTSTNYTWDTSSISHSTVAKVRIRAYDGNGYDGANYSSYDTSNTFTIDNGPPEVSLKRQVPTDLTNSHNGTVEIKLEITDPASGVNTSAPPHLHYRINNGTDPSYTDAGAMNYQGSDIWNATLPSRNYLTDANKTLEYYVSPITDNVGNTDTSTTWSDLIDDTAGAADLRVVASRRVVLDDPNAAGRQFGGDFASPLNPWGGSDYWKGDSTRIQFYAMIKGQNGTGVENQNLTFKLLKPDGSLLQQWNDVQTNGFGIANVSYQMNEATWFGEYTIRVETTYVGLQETDTANFIYNYWGCANCHSNKNPDQPETNGQNSPYTHGWGGIVDAKKEMYTHELFGNGFTETKCTHCHQSYDGLPGDRRDESKFDDLTSGLHGQRSKKCTFCHESITTHRSFQTIPDCFDCHPVYVQDINRIDITRTVPQAYVNYGDGTDFSVYSWNPEHRGPLTAHTEIYGKSTPSAYNTSKGVPCALCHGPMHNITKPDPVGTTNQYTEDSQCDTCHGTLKRRHPSINATLDYGCVDCHASKDRHSAHNVSASNRYFSSYPEFNTTAPPDPSWGLWKRWENAYNTTITNGGNTFQSESCESCHAAPNQPKGVHRLNLSYSQTATTATYFNGSTGTTLECQGCHGSDTNAQNEQDVHSAHPVSYGLSNTTNGGEGCICHSGAVASLPKSSLTSDNYTVTVFGTDWTYDASKQQRCTQCHGDWHTTSSYDTSSYPALSRESAWSLQNDTDTGSALTSSWIGAYSEISSSISPGTPGYGNCTVPPCHRSNAHEAMAKSTTAERFPNYTTTYSGKNPGCDECHGNNQWGTHQSAVLGVHGTQNDAYPACDTCHFPEPLDRGYGSIAEPGFDR